MEERSSNPEDPPVVYTTDEVARILRVTPRTIQRLTAAGLLPHRQVGIGTGARGARYLPEDVRQYLETSRRVDRPAPHA